MSKLLSIVIPTLDRCDYLKYTLSLILPQAERHLDEVELVVCCNACKDGTDSYMKNLCKEKTYIRYKYFDEYVEVGQSLIRSVGEAEGEYIVLWGDDDVPMPNFVDTILGILTKNPKVGIVYTNRIVAKDTKYGLRNQRVLQDVFETDDERLYDVSEFVPRFGSRLGFISSLIFRKDGWDKGVPYYNDTYYGYEHLSIIVVGNKESKCYYYPYPVEYQREPLYRDFQDKWPLYNYVGMPNMMKDFDKLGITTYSMTRWQNQVNKSTLHYIWNLAYCSAKRSFYKERMGELLKYQNSLCRKILAYLVVYLFPKSLFVMLKKRIYK